MESQIAFESKLKKKLLFYGKRMLILLLLALLVMAANARSRGPAMAVAAPANIGVTGVYAGTIPCADCEGISYRLALSADGTYREQMTYQGKSTKPYIGHGRYKVIGDSLVKLDKRDAGMSTFRIEGTGLRMLDAEGQTITGDNADRYLLVKLTRGGPMSAGERNAKGDKMDKRLLYRKYLDGIGFIASGNEPSWGLDIKFRKFIRFFTQDGDTLTVPAPEPSKAMDANVIRYYKQTDKGTLTVQIQEQECTNTMSGEKWDYTVTVDVVKGGYSEPKNYTGCGRYVPDIRLNGKWLLQSMNGKAIDTADYPRGIPYMQLKPEEGRYNGSAGCNGMMGRLMTTGDREIRFSQAATTMMMCPNISKEQEFLKILEKLHKYRLNGDVWSLEGWGNVKMVFVRAKGTRGRGQGKGK